MWVSAARIAEGRIRSTSTEGIVRIRSVLFLIAVGALAWVATPTAQQDSRHSTAARRSAKAWTPPRTPWGDPDLQGIYTNKDENNTPFERPPELAGKRLADFG